jgi:hypothetical protein
LLTLGRLHLRQGRLDEAREAVRQALSVWERGGRPQDRAEMEALLAEVQAASGDRSP